jgi:acetyl-CoA/propionyl-CoA carboxylase, biotin carboxylase, biotin carboxyl carrier protein
VHTSWIETEFTATGPAPQPAAELARVPVGGRPMTVRLPGLAALGTTTAALSRREGGDAAAEAGGDAVLAPMQGTVIKVAVADGQRAEPGDVIAVVEAMKMENPVTAHKAGTVTGLRVAAGDSVAQDQVLCELTGEAGPG